MLFYFGLVFSSLPTNRTNSDIIYVVFSQINEIILRHLVDTCTLYENTSQLLNEEKHAVILEHFNITEQALYKSF